MTAHRIPKAATAALDKVLDVLVVPGFSSIGPALRRHWWAPDAEPFVDQRDVIVTGAGSGLGEATAKGLAALGATVHMVGRSAERLRSAVDRIHADLARCESGGPRGGHQRSRFGARAGERSLGTALSTP